MPLFGIIKGHFKGLGGNHIALEINKRFKN